MNHNLNVEALWQMATNSRMAPGTILTAGTANFTVVHHHAPGGGAPTVSLEPFHGDTESVCGEEFDSYMLRAPAAPFPYDPNNPAHRELRDVWAGRRVCVESGDGWKEGAVAWLSQSNVGPYAPRTRWGMGIRFDTKDDDEAFQLLRCNVRRGGTLQKAFDKAGRDDDTPIRFEFLSPAMPDPTAVHASPGALPPYGAFTPYEPPHADPAASAALELARAAAKAEWREAAADPDYTKLVRLLLTTTRSILEDACAGAEGAARLRSRMAELPLRAFANPLLLAHVVSNEKTSALAKRTAARYGWPLLDLDQQLVVLQALHDALVARASAPELLETRGPFALANADVDVGSVVLLTDGSADDDGYLAVVTRTPTGFWFGRGWDLKVFCPPSGSSSLAAEGELEVLQAYRPTAWQSDLAVGPAVSNLFPHIWPATPSEPFGAQAFWMICNSAGEALEEKGRHHTAATWYARVLEVNGPLQVTDKVLASPICNLGLAKKRAGEVEEALVLYDRALQLSPTATTLIHNQKVLVSELKHWGIALPAAQ